MDYAHAGYYAAPVQQYPYYGVPSQSRTSQPYTPQDEHSTNPMVSQFGSRRSDYSMRKLTLVNRTPSMTRMASLHSNSHLTLLLNP